MTTNSQPSRPDRTAPLPDPSDETFGVVAVAWPTGRTIYQYTLDELARGVDLYTRAMKARTAATLNRGRHGEETRDAQ